MSNFVSINEEIKDFNKIISVSGDKSISIRWVLFSSLANGVSKAQNLLMSEDVLAAINLIKKLGIKVKIEKNLCKIYGKGFNGYKYRENLTLDAKNSGTLGRLILGLLVNSKNKIKLIGDRSLSKRDFKRISSPLSKFGVKFKHKNKFGLPLEIQGIENLRPITYEETRGSAQCKSSIIFAGMRTKGKTIVKAKKSRDHTELLCKYLKIPLKIKKEKEFDFIEIQKVNKIKSIKYKIPSDISSAAFFIVLVALSKKSSIKIKNVNINPSRIGVVKILRKMGISINFKNQKLYKGEQIADIYVKSPKKIKSINCSSDLNSQAIDEFLIIFLVAAKAEGISYFKGLSELNKKESPRLDWAYKILRLMGIKTVKTNSSIAIIGNPKLKIKKNIVIKNFLKDHRVFMTCVIAALSFGGRWKIHDKDSIKTSFPSFLQIVSSLKK